MDTRELRELAKRATPGPYYTVSACGGDCHLTVMSTVERQPLQIKNPANAEYIAALSPDVLEGLLDEIDVSDELVQMAGKYQDDCEKAEAERDALRAENERLTRSLKYETERANENAEAAGANLLNNRRLEAERDELVEAAREAIAATEQFIRDLPDGEYKGLGELRTAVIHRLRRALAAQGGK
jgi:ElaB/YqjD/DUF883 family membrane-anchored ribosome-binding protein